MEVISYINHRYVSSLTEPEQSLRNKEFNQSELIHLVNINYPESSLNPGGVCFGLVITWYYFKSLVSELSVIQELLRNKQTLTSEQLDILKCINILQKRQEDADKINKKKQILEHSVSKKNGEEEIKIIVKLAVDCAIFTPGALLTLNPFNTEGVGHVIGLIATLNTRNRIEICYFDPNYRETILDYSASPEKTIEDIANLLRYAYEPYYRISSLETVGEFKLGIQYYFKNENNSHPTEQNDPPASSSDIQINIEVSNQTQTFRV